jgi:hypothetical protein
MINTLLSVEGAIKTERRNKIIGLPYPLMTREGYGHDQPTQIGQ